MASVADRYIAATFNAARHAQARRERVVRQVVDAIDSDIDAHAVGTPTRVTLSVHRDDAGVFSDDMWWYRTLGFKLDSDGHPDTRIRITATCDPASLLRFEISRQLQLPVMPPRHKRR